MHRRNIAFYFFTTSGTDHRSTFVVNIKHQSLSLHFVIAKIRLEYVRHISHQVNGVIPNECDPGNISEHSRLSDFHRGNTHRNILSLGRDVTTRKIEMLKKISFTLCERLLFRLFTLRQTFINFFALRAHGELTWVTARNPHLATECFNWCA